jgi:hypothetical protein
MVDVVSYVDSRITVEVVWAAQDDLLLLLPLRPPAPSRNWTTLEGRRLLVLSLSLWSRVKCGSTERMVTATSDVARETTGCWLLNKEQ